MKLVPIKENIWKFYALCDKHENCELLEFLGNIDAKYQKHSEKLITLIVSASNNVKGPKIFDDSVSHYVHKNEKIYEFVAGDLRLLWFYSKAERRVIICSHTFIKKSRKTPQKEAQKAIALKKAYIKAQENNQIEIIDG